MSEFPVSKGKGMLSRERVQGIIESLDEQGYIVSFYFHTDTGQTSGFTGLHRTLSTKEFLGYTERCSKRIYTYSTMVSIHRYKMLSSWCKGLVLEIGSGTGWGQRIITDSSKVDEVIAIDLDSNHLVYSKKNCPSSHYILADIFHLPIRDNLIDSLVASEVIEHVDINGAIVEIQRVTRNGGLVLLSTPNAGYILRRFQASNPYHVHEFKPDEIINLATKTCFDVLMIRGIYVNVPILPTFLEAISVYLNAFRKLRKALVTSLRILALFSIEICRVKFLLPLASDMVVILRKQKMYRDSKWHQ